MSLPRIATREEWLAARKELLAKEKELTRMRDRVDAERRRLPMVRVDKPYAFDHRVLDGRVLLVEHRPTGEDIPRARTPEIGRSHPKAAEEELTTTIVAGHVTVEPGSASPTSRVA